MEIGNGVVGVRDPFYCCRINAVFHQHGRKGCPPKYRLAHDDMAPCRWHTIWTNADLDAMYMHRTIVATLYIIFPCPHKLDRSAAQTLGDRRCLALHMRIRSGPPAKASTGHLGMESDLCGLQPKDFRDRRLIDGLELRASPHFSTVAVNTYGRIQWLHGTMGQVRELILRHNAIATGNPSQRLLIAAGHRDVARRTSELVILRP